MTLTSAKVNWARPSVYSTSVKEIWVAERRARDALVVESAIVTKTRK